MRARDHFFGGFLGFIGALTLKEWSDLASAAAGFGTFVYMGICIYHKLKKHK